MLTRTKLWWLAALLLANVAFGQSCPEQTFKDPLTCPTTLDPAKVIDPNTKTSILLDWRFVPQGKVWTVSGHYCHPFGYSMKVTASTGTLSYNAGNWTINGQAPTVGVIYLTIAATSILPTDGTAAGQTPTTRRGVIAIIVVPPDPGPVLYLAAPVAQWDMWPYPQQREVVRQFKLTGVWWRNLPPAGL